LIPFSSEIKFNMYIRDMNKNEKNPKNVQDNLMIILKGAPEKVLNRCSKILINGEEREFDDFWKKKVNKANESFGNMGERVLAFARY
jgi:sodium/potassium-transporting ATPase subunit alpha